MPQNEPIDAEFEDVPPTTRSGEARGVPAQPPLGRRTTAQSPAQKAHVLADLLELGADVTTAGASVARVLSEDAANRAERAADVGRASAEVLRSGVAAVQHIQAETEKAAGPFALALMKWRDKAKAAGVLGDPRAPQAIHRGPRRVVTVTQSKGAAK